MNNSVDNKILLNIIKIDEKIRELSDEKLVQLILIHSATNEWTKEYYRQKYHNLEAGCKKLAYKRGVLKRRLK